MEADDGKGEFGACFPVVLIEFATSVLVGVFFAAAVGAAAVGAAATVDAAAFHAAATARACNEKTEHGLRMRNTSGILSVTRCVWSIRNGKGYDRRGI